MSASACVRAVAALAAMFVGFTARPAEAFEYRRPNLVGPYTDRRMTNPVNAMTLIGGPGSSFTFGQRYDERNTEGGFEFGRYRVEGDAPAEPVDEAWTRLGIGFGLLPYLDAGAVFLNFKWAPNFDFTEVLVYVTQAFNLGDLELGIRFSFLTPSKENGWQLNPGLMAVYRGGQYKLEAGVFSAVGVGAVFRTENLAPASGYAGLNVPLRATFNVTPQLYLGADTGLAVPRFDTPDRTTVPLGALVGYTLLAGGRLLDFAVSFKWDELLYVAPPSGVDAFQPAIYRFNVGVTMHKMAVGPPK